MGITIHYTFISKNPMKINEAINLAKKYLEKHEYKVKDFEVEGILQYAWFGFTLEDDKDKDLEETFALTFYKFHDYYICDEFCKTQPFKDDEYLPNIKHHINFVNTIEIIEKYMDNVYVEDEGDYYETHDVQKLSEAFGANARMIWQIVSELSNVSNENFGFTIGGKIDGKKFKKYKKEP